MRYVRVGIIVLFCGVAFSCQKKESSNETENSVGDFKIVREAIFSKLLTPGEAAAKLQSMGAEFNGSLLNDPSHWSSYTTAENKAAANLGVYLSDLNYSVAYQQKEPIKNYFNACLELSTTLGAKPEMLNFVKTRFQANIEKNDSVKNLLAKLDAGAVSYLKDTERENLAGIALSAYYIENLHIALGLIESYPKDLLPEDARTVILVPAFQLVLNQKENVKLIYAYLKETAKEDNPNYLFYKNALEELIGTYDKLNVDDKIKNNQVKDLLTDSVVKELSDKVDQIRNKVVGI